MPQPMLTGGRARHVLPFLLNRTATRPTRDRTALVTTRLSHIGEAGAVAPPHGA